MQEEGSAHGLSGSTVGHYRIESLIGKGGMGEVYLASDLKLRRKVAIKALPESLAEEASARARFLRECRLACKVVHPYVATVFDVIEHAERPLIVMERIEGSRLDQWVRTTAPKPESLAALGLEIAEALAAIHRAGIVHRDLKPGNVMVTPDGHVKVTDFGVSLPVPGLPDDLSTVAAEEADPVTRTGMGVGTVAYMSPEQVRGERLDGRSDLFSLGIVLYEAVTGEHPFRRESLLGTASAILHDPPSGGREHPTLTGSGPFRDVILRLLQKSPALRYASAEDLATDLRAVLRGEGISPKPRPPIPWKRVSAAALAVAVVGAVGGWLATRNGDGGGGEAAGPRPVIAVLPFDDQTGDAEGPARAAMAADLLRSILGQSKSTRAFDEERVLNVLGRFPAGVSREVVLRSLVEPLAPDWVAAGRLYREGDTWIASLDLFRGGRTEPERTFKVSAVRANALADLAAAKILDAISSGRDGGGANEARGLASRVDEAQLLFHRAAQARRDFRLAEAIRLLEESTRIDPDFALAWSRLADARNAAGYGKKAREAAAKAISLVAHLPELVRAEVSATDAAVRDDLEALLAGRRMQADGFPDDPVVQVALADALRRTGKLDAADAALDRAAGIDPRDPRIPIAVARLRRAERRYSEADAALEAAERLLVSSSRTGGRAAISRVRAETAYAAGKFEEAASHYDRGARAYREAGLPELAAILDLGVADCDARRGRILEAESRYADVIPRLRAIGAHRNVVNTLANLGGVLFARGEIEKAERTLREAVTEAGIVENPLLGLGAQTNLASLLGYTGRLAESGELAASALATAREYGDRNHENTLLLIVAVARRGEGLLMESADAYRQVLRGTEGQPPSSLSGQARIGLAEALLDLGRPADARVEADRGIRDLRAAGERAMLGYGLIVGGRTLAAVAEWDASEKALAEASAIASETGLADLGPRVSLERAVAANLRGDDSAARSGARVAVSDGSKSGAVEIEAPGWVVICEAELASGHVEAANDAAARALRHGRAQFLERLAARICRAQALIRAGRVAEAGRESRLALEDAERAGATLHVARAAAAALAARETGADSEAVRERGRRSLDAFFAAAPADRVAAIRERRDIAETMTALRQRTDGTPEPDETSTKER